MAQFAAPTLIPTSDWWDSWNAWIGYDAPGASTPSDSPYVATRQEMFGPPSIVRANVVGAGQVGYQNPDNRYSTPSPQWYQMPPVGVVGSAQRADTTQPNYTSYQTNPRPVRPTYLDLIGAYAPRTTSGVDALQVEGY